MFCQGAVFFFFYAHYPSEYRDFVIAGLPQLTNLDGQEISKTDRLKAARELTRNRRAIVQRETEYRISRDEQKLHVQKDLEAAERELEDVADEEEKVKR